VLDTGVLTAEQACALVIAEFAKPAIPARSSVLSTRRA
jgi:hypothetical protein